MSLGRLYLKLAQGAPQGGALENLVDQANQGRTPYSTGSVPETAGTASPYQFGVAGVSDLFGPEYAAFAPIIMQVLQSTLSPEMFKTLMQQKRVGVGPGSLGEAQATSDAITTANTKLMGRMGARTAAGLDALAKSNSIPDALKPAVKWLNAAAQSNSVATGGIVGALRQMPTIGPMLAPYFRDVPTSYAPLIIASTQANGGVFSPEKMNQMVKEFETNYDRGLYKDKDNQPIDADVALGGHALGAAIFGGNVNGENSLELARVASSIMNNGLASDSASAYSMLRGMGPLNILKNPVAFDQKMRDISSRLKAAAPEGGVPKYVAGVMQAAARSGLSPTIALDRAADGLGQRQFWERSGQFGDRMGMYDTLQAVKERAETEGATRADSMKALTAWTTLTSEGRGALSNYLQAPTPAKAQAMFAASREAPTVNQRHDFNPQDLLSKFTNTQRDALNQGEMMDTFRSSPLLSDVATRPEAYTDVLTDPVGANAGKLLQGANQWERKMMLDPTVRAMALAAVPRPAPPVSPLVNSYQPSDKLKTDNPEKPIETVPAVKPTAPPVPVPPA